MNNTRVIVNQSKRRISRTQKQDADLYNQYEYVIKTMINLERG